MRCSCLRLGRITDDALPYDRPIAPCQFKGEIANRDCYQCAGTGSVIMPQRCVCYLGLPRREVKRTGIALPLPGEIHIPVEEPQAVQWVGDQEAREFPFRRPRFRLDVYALHRVTQANNNGPTVAEYTEAP